MYYNARTNDHVLPFGLTCESNLFKYQPLIIGIPFSFRRRKSIVFEMAAKGFLRWFLTREMRWKQWKSQGVVFTSVNLIRKKQFLLVNFERECKYINIHSKATGILRGHLRSMWHHGEVCPRWNTRMWQWWAVNILIWVVFDIPS